MAIPTVELAAVDVEAAPEKPGAGALVGFGVQAQNWDEGLRIARILATSELLPKQYIGKAADIVVAMQYGAEIGLPPMAALRSIAVINGRPGLYGDGFLGVIMASPHYLQHDEYYLVGGERRDRLTTADLQLGDTTAVAAFSRRGVPVPFVATFSIDDAKRAQLWGKQGPWTQYPARMLRWRAREFAGRDAFAAALLGMGMVEVLGDVPSDDPEVSVEAVSAPIVIRRSEKAAAAVAPAAEDVPLTSELPPEAPARAQPLTTAPATTKRSNGGPAASAQTATGYIGATSYVTPIGAEAYYEAQILAAPGGKVAMFYRTTDEGLAQLLNSCEGSAQLYTLTFVATKDTAAKVVRVLQAIAVAE